MQARRKTGRRVWLSAGVLAALIGTCAMAVQRRLHLVLWTPAPPSRGMDTGDFVPAPEVSRLRVLFVGHSLVNEEMPAMARAVAESLGVDWTHDVSLIDGASLAVGWSEGHRARGVRARDALASGGYDALVLTEMVNLDDALRWSSPSEHAGLFYAHARRVRPDIGAYFYETWHHRDGSRKLLGLPHPRSWREQLDADLGKWEHIVDETERREPGLHVDIVPGGQAMAALVDAIARGEVPGVTDEGALFRDEIHPSPLGNYFVALVQVATLTRRSPVGATHSLRDGAGAPFALEAETAEALQRIAWRTVSAYPRSGVRRPAP